jgi:diaminopimelate decarboxylase
MLKPIGRGNVSSWLYRPALEEITAVVSAARSAGLLGEPSCIFHSLDLLDRRIDELVEAFPSTSLHAVAIKANPVVRILRHIVRGSVGLEAASFEEVALAIAAGCPPRMIVYDSPAKTDDELREALRLGVHVNADSLDEVDRAIRLRPLSSTSVLGLRVNPGVGDGSIPETSVAAATSRFGEPIGSVFDALARRAQSHLWIRGLHYHVGSQGASPEIHAAAARVVSRLRGDLHAELGRAQFDVIDIGGGATADYSGEPVMTPAEIASMVRQAAPDFFTSDTRLITEYGRALQASCGWAVTAVQQIKHIEGHDVALVHLGADLLLRPAYRPEHWKHRFSLLPATTGPGPRGESRRWTICGPLCFAGDVIGRGVELTDLEPGDRLVIHDVGAYTVSMWSRHCSRGMPPIVGYRVRGSDVELSILRRGETPEDVVRFWSEDPASATKSQHADVQVGRGRTPNGA